MPWAGFEPTIPAFKREKTVHALDRAATVISHIYLRLILILLFHLQPDLFPRELFVLIIFCFPVSATCTTITILTDFNHPNNCMWAVPIFNLLVMFLSSFRCYWVQMFSWALVWIIAHHVLTSGGVSSSRHWISYFTFSLSPFLLTV
jgi:hypothetical protein